MTAVFLIASDELRYLRRSNAAWFILLTLLFVSICAAIVSDAEVSRRAEERLAQQAEADAIFQAQPDRHPHRMVHYGHYVYRPASPLAVIEPGIDSMVGTSIFLEGHRQNTATFALARETGLLARFGSFSPAFVLQILAPLLLIISGYASVTREKESKALYQLIGQGVGKGSILIGKAIALWSVAFFALIPLILLGLMATEDDPLSFRQSLLIMSFGYLAYLSVWVLLIVSASATFRTSAQSLSALLGIWIVISILMPRIAGAYANAALPFPSQIETNLKVAEALRVGGDSHDIEDAAFDDLETETLAEYGVDKIEDLPFNYRGLVALRGEEADTEVLAKFAEERMDQELEQKLLMDRFSWFSPLISLRAFSMALAGTSLQDHHHFLRAAEDYRFNMVQTFNRLQMTEMTLAEDLSRNESAEATDRTRVDSSNWGKMPVFDLEPLGQEIRWRAALQSGMIIFAWLFLALILILVSARRLQP